MCIPERLLLGSTLWGSQEPCGAAWLTHLFATAAIEHASRHSVLCAHPNRPRFCILRAVLERMVGAWVLTRAWKLASLHQVLHDAELPVLKIELD